MSQVPSLRQFCLETAPYAEFTLSAEGAKEVPWIEEADAPLDTYCVQCGQDSVFQPKPKPKYGAKSGWVERDLTVKDGVYNVQFLCSRDQQHLACFVFRVLSGRISKVGQSPSMADLQKSGVKKYKKVLGEQRLGEFTRAVGLRAHGVGIGAFVYLRRIYEHLISQANDAARSADDWDQEAFERGRMEDKILALKDHLPTFLVDHRRVYSILSLGLHELSENDCLKYFEPVKTAIELILDEKLAQREREEKIAATSKDLARINEQLGPKRT